MLADIEPDSCTRSLVGHDVHQGVGLTAKAEAARNRRTDGKPGFVAANVGSPQAALLKLGLGQANRVIVRVAGGEEHGQIVIGQRRERYFCRIESDDAWIKGGYLDYRTDRRASQVKSWDWRCLRALPASQR
jgi:hypothetical protein